MLEWDCSLIGQWVARSAMSDRMDGGTYWVIDVTSQGTFQVHANPDLDCETEWELPSLALAKAYCQRCEAELIGGDEIYDECDKFGDGPLAKLAEHVWAVNEDKGWNEGLDQRTEGDWAALAHSEISEAFEEFRDGRPHVYIGAGQKPEGAAVEYIDCIYRILHWFAWHKIDPDEVFRMKLEYNKTRPYRHGGKKA